MIQQKLWDGVMLWKHTVLSALRLQYHGKKNLSCVLYLSHFQTWKAPCSDVDVNSSLSTARIHLTKGKHG